MIAGANRTALVARGRRLAYITIGWNCVEGLVSLLAGWAAGSWALVGFGIDSWIEVASGAAVLWRLARDERSERATQRVIGLCFFGLAAFLVYTAGSQLLVRRAEVEPSAAGIAVACASLIAMPILGRAKRRVAAGLGSGAVHADSRQTDFCAWLAAILLGGLLLNAAAGWWWADPVAGLVMAPIIAREGLAGWHGHACCDSCQD